MPVITSIATGAQSRRFQVTTLLDASDQVQVDLEAFKAAVQEKRSRIDELGRGGNNREALVAAEQDLERSMELVRVLEEQRKTASVYVGVVKLSDDFFGRAVYLSTSAGLHLESYACALSGVYTIGPVFQADDDESQSAKKLAEMWMVEVELAFAELEVVHSLHILFHLVEMPRFLRFPLTRLSGRHELRRGSSALPLLLPVGDCRQRSQIFPGRSCLGNPSLGRTREVFSIEEVGLPHEQYDWYMDLCRHGSVKRSGFSLELEKMVVMATGITDAKDAIPFPRAHGDAKL
ncbi:hypothetical protein B296_00008105 [Ensete ventricosum]|uniref:Aminoacyl-tRNA synthetase class II (D/K/N) domain-containing protein n=1 Tax=Ensete ventricosum TaxID=4639 RepID=A0A426ZZW9_ENSVE|nr:hypothetical protein B296_00008105 [Ensete ventricosum]